MSAQTAPNQRGLQTKFCLLALLPLPLAAQSIAERHDALAENAAGLNDIRRANAQRPFDIREFHDFLLSAGAIPFDVPEQRFGAWLADRQ